MAGRHYFLPVTHLDGEGLKAPPQEGIGAVVEGRQGWHVAIPGDQHMGGGKELLRQLGGDLVGSSVKLTRNSLGSAECSPH